MQNTKEKFLKFGKATEKELLTFQKYIKESITSFNNLEDLASLIDGKFSKENKFSLNSSSYLNQIKVKIIIDFLEILKISITLANGINEYFLKFHKLVCNICKNFLLNREITFRDSAIFVNLIIINFPFYSSQLTKKEFFQLQKSDDKKGILIGFNHASILAVKNPIYRLWSKKCFYTCECHDDKKFTVRYASIYKPDNYNNLSFYETSCKNCKKPFHTDKNSELFIEAQEIILLISTQGNSFLNNKISLWLYGDMINSLREGEKITFLSFYCNFKSNNFQQKDFSLGNFVAVNINIYFDSLKYLKNVFMNFELLKGGKEISTNKPANKNLFDKHFKISEAIKENKNFNNKNFIDLLKEKEKSFISQHNDEVNLPHENIYDKNQMNKQNYFNNLNKLNFNARFNEDSEINILRSINFGKQICSSFFNLIYIMFLGYLDKALFNKIRIDAEKNSYLYHSKINNYSIFDINDLSHKNFNESFLQSSNKTLNENEITFSKFNFYVHLACKLSIVQREYFTKLKQYFYLHNCQNNFENYNRKNQTFINGKNVEESNCSNNKNSDNKKNILSRSVIFKTKIFDNREKEKINEDYKKYFKFARQGLNEYNNSCDLLMKPLNLLFIFDEISVENLSEIYSLMKNMNLGFSRDIGNYSQSSNSYQNLFVVYPYFFPNKLQKESIINFLKSNNNKIILIPDIDILTKFELEILSSILANNFNLENNLNLSKAMEYNITFWFVCSYKKMSLREKKNNQHKGNFQDNKFKAIELFVNNSEIILNLSEKFNNSRGFDKAYFDTFYSNINKDLGKTNKQAANLSRNNMQNDIKDGNFQNQYLINYAKDLSTKLNSKNIDFNYEKIKIINDYEKMNKSEKINCIGDFLFTYMLTQKNIQLISSLKENICKENHWFGKIETGELKNNNSSGNLNSHDFDDSFSSSKLLEDYFLIKRNINRVNFNDIVKFNIISFI